MSMRWVLGAIALLVGMAATVGVIAQSESGHEVRVRAMRLGDGRTEFEIQQKQQDGGWSDSLFASNPRLSSQPAIGRWYHSSAVRLIPWPDVSMQLEGSAVSPAEGGEGVEDSGQDWTPLADTGGEIDVRYSVNLDPLTGEYATRVRKAHSLDEFGFENIVISVGCQGGNLEFAIADTSDWLIFSGATEQITLRVPGRDAISGAWPYMSTDEHTANGYSPENDLAVVQLLREADVVYVRLGTDPVREIDLAGLFDTPAQENLDRCGTY